MENEKSTDQKIDRGLALRTVIKTFIEFHCQIVQGGVPPHVAGHLITEITGIFRELSHEWGWTDEELRTITHEAMVEHGRTHHGLDVDKATDAANKTTEILLPASEISHLN